jgi:hypothetical protein
MRKRNSKTFPSACRLRENARSLAFDDGIKLERVDWKPPERGRKSSRKPEAEQAEAPNPRWRWPRGYKRELAPSHLRSLSHLQAMASKYPAGFCSETDRDRRSR